MPGQEFTSSRFVKLNEQLPVPRIVNLEALSVSNGQLREQRMKREMVDRPGGAHFRGANSILEVIDANQPVGSAGCGMAAIATETDRPHPREFIAIVREYETWHGCIHEPDFHL